MFDTLPLIIGEKRKGKQIFHFGILHPPRVVKVNTIRKEADQMCPCDYWLLNRFFSLNMWSRHSILQHSTPQTLPPAFSIRPPSAVKGSFCTSTLFFPCDLTLRRADWTPRGVFPLSPWIEQAVRMSAVRGGMAGWGGWTELAGDAPDMMGPSRISFRPNTIKSLSHGLRGQRRWRSHAEKK